jgi:hypothetical protein
MRKYNELGIVGRVNAKISGVEKRQVREEWLERGKE